MRQHLCKYQNQVGKTNEMSQTDTILDTLELTSDLFFSKSHESYYNQAIRKYHTIQKVKSLVDVTTEDRKPLYWQAYHCNNIILQQGQTLIGSRCRKRWCQECSRIKTAEMINGYNRPLEELAEADDLYFITLTAPTVKGRQLRAEIRKRLKAFQLIKDNLRKNYGIKLVGIRKIEVTYNEKTNEYHPHFHFIQQGYNEAKALMNEWYKYFPKASSKAQDMRLIDVTNSNNLKEIFKYATKDVIKDETTAKAQDTIYKAIEGRRIFQTYGSLKKVKEPIEETEMRDDVDFISFDMEIWKYDNSIKDWTTAKNDTLIGTEYIESNCKRATDRGEQLRTRHEH